MGLRLFLLTYMLGGLTFIPLLLLAVIVPAWYLLPQESTQPPSVFAEDERNARSRKSLEVDSKVDSKGGDQKRTQSLTGETAASGTFAVLRQYDFQAAITALNARNSGSGSGIPTGDGSAGADPDTNVGSQSVYQSMYRSVFNKASNTRELLQRGTGDDSNDKDQSQGQAAAAAKSVRRKPVPANVLYILLRHGHLMIYESSAQVEVKHVISLAHHTIGLQSGVGVEEEEDYRQIPEPDLFIKRTAIVLRPIELPNGSLQPHIPGHAAPKPFYLFCPSNIEKEDFYHALLATRPSPPVPRPLDTDALTKLQKALHSSSLTPETRAFSALLGRIFLALHRSEHITALIRSKIDRKLDRIPKPSFIPSLSLQSLDLGDATPTISAPRLRDFDAVSGEMTLALDVRYTEGTFALTLLAVATLDLGLGPRFKPRSVTLALKTSLQRVVGTLLLRIKPPPSNRIWFTFETMPDLGIRVEPVVSERKITYGFVLRAIEERIIKAVGEGLVKPNWDDAPMPLAETVGSHARGGLWTSEGDDDDQRLRETTGPIRKTSSSSATSTLGQNGRSASTPTLIPDLAEGSATNNFTTTGLSATASEVNLSHSTDLRRRPTTASIASTSSSSTLVDPPAPALPTRRKPVRSPSLSAPAPASSAPPVVALAAAGHHHNTNPSSQASSVDSSTADLRGAGPGGLGVSFISSQPRHSRQSSIGSTNSGVAAGNSLWRRATAVVGRNPAASQKDAIEELRHLAEREMYAAQAAELIAAHSEDEFDTPVAPKSDVAGGQILDNSIPATDAESSRSAEDVTSTSAEQHLVRSPSLISKSSSLSSSSSTAQHLQASSPRQNTSLSSASGSANDRSGNSNTNAEPVLSGKRTTSGGSTSTTPNSNKKSNLLSATATAATAARNWGWNQIQKRNNAANQPPATANARSPRQQASRQQRDRSPAAAASVAAALATQNSRPYGRGQPLPPPGVPLPGPARDKNGRSGWIGGGGNANASGTSAASTTPGKNPSERKNVADSGEQRQQHKMLQSGASNESIDGKNDSRHAGNVPAVSVTSSAENNDNGAHDTRKLKNKASSNSLASATHSEHLETFEGDLSSDLTPSKPPSRPSGPSLVLQHGENLADTGSHAEDDFGPWRMNSGSGPAGSAGKAREKPSIEEQKRRSVKLEDDLRAEHRADNETSRATERRATQQDQDEEDYGAFNHNHGDDSDDEHDFRDDIFTLHRPRSRGGKTSDIAPLTSSATDAPKAQPQKESESVSCDPTELPPALPARRRKPIPDSHPQAVPFIVAENPASSSPSTSANKAPIPAELGDPDLADVHLGLVPSSSPALARASAAAEKTRAEDTSDAAIKIPPQAVKEVEREVGGSRGKADGGEEELIDL